MWLTLFFFAIVIGLFLLSSGVVGGGCEFLAMMGYVLVIAAVIGVGVWFSGFLFQYVWNKVLYQCVPVPQLTWCQSFCTAWLLFTLFGSGIKINIGNRKCKA